MRDLKLAVAVPGESRAHQSDVDEAIALARQGMARKIEKPRGALPESIPDVPPPSPEMSYDEAYALMEQGELKKPTLTDQGWLVPPAHRIRL